MIRAALAVVLILPNVALKAGPPEQERWMRQQVNIGYAQLARLQEEQTWPAALAQSFDGVTFKLEELTMDKSVFKGNFSMSTGKCTGKFEHGFRKCQQHWNQDWQGRLQLEQIKPLEAGTKISVHTWSKGMGVLSMMSLPDVKSECNMCGGTCHWPIAAMAGMPVLPTVEDIKKLPLVGSVAGAMARTMKVPENRESLNAAIAGPLEHFARDTGYWDPKDLELSQHLVKINGNSIDMKTMKCPVDLNSQRKTGMSFPWSDMTVQGGDFAWKVNKMGNMLGPMQMKVSTELRMTDHTGKQIFKMRITNCMNCEI